MILEKKINNDNIKDGKIIHLIAESKNNNTLRINNFPSAKYDSHLSIKCLNNQKKGKEEGILESVNHR